MAAVVRTAEAEVPESASLWVLTNIFPDAMVSVSQRDGTWSVVSKGPAATGQSFDGALVSAVGRRRT